MMSNDLNYSVSKDANKENKIAKIKLYALRTITYIFLGLLTFLCLIFFYILIINATKSKAELQSVFKMYPSTHFFQNMKSAFEQTETVNIIKGFSNSFLVASLTAVLTTYFSALTAFGIYAYRFKGRNFLAIFILAIMMIPVQASSVGFIQLAYKFKLNNYLFLLIVPGIAAPAVYFYMIQYLKATLPLELVESSRIDGSNEFMTFNRIVLPVMKPAIAVQLIFQFVLSWNNYYLPALLITDKNKRTLPIMLALLRSQQESQADPGEIWMVIFLSILPVVIVYLILSKLIIKGVTSGSVKG